MGENQISQHFGPSIQIQHWQRQKLLYKSIRIIGDVAGNEEIA